MTFGRWPEWSVSAARERAKEIRREIDAGADPLAQRGALREAPRVDDLIERYCAQHLPKLAERNASDQKSALAKMVAPVWGRKLVTEITSSDVDKLLSKVAEGRARPHKEMPNNRAKKLQPAKPTPVRANRIGEVLAQDVHPGGRVGLVRGQPRPALPPPHRDRRANAFCPRKKSPSLAAALDAAEDRRAADIIRMCMLTGARLGRGPAGPVRTVQPRTPQLVEATNHDETASRAPRANLGRNRHHCAPT